MKRIAYLCCRDTAASSPQRRSDAFEHDYSMEVFAAAFAREGFALDEAIWDDRDVDWNSFDAAIIGTTWDYDHRPAKFLAFLTELAEQMPVANPVSAVAWNLAKTYLRDLEDGGARIVPTIWGDRLSRHMIADAAERFGTKTLVLKPVIGAGGLGQFVSRALDVPDDDHHLWTHPVMIQPFVDHILDEGELSFIYFAGQFSHAVRKTAAQGEYRIQAIFGGGEQAHRPSPGDRACADAIIAALPHPFLYARLDLVRMGDGELAVMECELIEPYLFPLADSSKGENFARAFSEWFAKKSCTGGHLGSMDAAFRS